MFHINSASYRASAEKYSDKVKGVQLLIADIEKRIALHRACGKSPLVISMWENVLRDHNDLAHHFMSQAIFFNKLANGEYHEKR